MIGAQTLVEMLKRYQVDIIFGVPGDTSIALYEALYDAKADIHHIMARDERSASFMADAYARLSHKPGICECPSGAGYLYSVPGVAEANASSVPVILITSDIPLSGEGKQTITELDTRKLFESITKWSNVLKDVNKIPEVIRRAFRIATTGRPGAVHLALPREVSLGSFTNVENDLYAEESCCRYPAYRTRGAGNVLERLADLAADAKRLVIIAGGGANHSAANDPAIVAEGFGLKAMRIKTPEELVEGLNAAFSGDLPVFVDVSTESEVENFPPVYQWLKAVEGSGKKG